MTKSKTHEEELDRIINELDKKYPRQSKRINWPAHIVGLFLLGCMLIAAAAITYKIFMWAFGMGS